MKRHSAATLSSKPMIKDYTKITLKAKHSLNQGSMMVQPSPKPDGYGYYGVENFSDEEKRRQPFVITPETTFKVKHNTVIDLADPWQRAVWEGFLRYDRRIAQNSSEAANNPFALYYVDDEEEKVAKSVSTYRERFDLDKWVESITDEDKKELCNLLNYRTEGNSMERVVEFLFKKIHEGDGWRKVKEARGWMESGHASKINLVRRLVDRKIIRMDNKWFYYGGEDGTPKISIGDSIDKVIFWVDQRENVDVVRRWLAMLGQKAPLTIPTSQADNIYAEADQKSVTAAPTLEDLSKGIPNPSALDDLIKEMNNPVVMPAETVKVKQPKPGADK